MWLSIALHALTAVSLASMSTLAFDLIVSVPVWVGATPGLAIYASARALTVLEERYE